MLPSADLILTAHEPTPSERIRLLSATRIETVLDRSRNVKRDASLIQCIVAPESIMVLHLDLRRLPENLVGPTSLEVEAPSSASSHDWHVRGGGTTLGVSPVAKHAATSMVLNNGWLTRSLPKRNACVKGMAN